MVAGAKVRRAVNALVEKAKSRNKESGRSDISRSIIVAGRILEIYAAGGDIKDVAKEFDGPVRDPHTGRVWTKSHGDDGRLLAWAAKTYLSDEVKQIGAAKVIKDFEAIVKGSMADVADWGPDGVRLKDSATLTPQQQALVTELSEGEHGVRIKIADRMKALGHLKDIFIGDKVKIEGEIKHTHRLAERLDDAIKQLNPPTIDAKADVD